MTFSALGPLIEIGGKIIDRVIPDPAAKAEAQLRLAELAQRGELAQLAADTDLLKGQIAINQEQAKSSNLFVAGARPFVMWVCGIGLAIEFVVRPFAVAFGFREFPHIDQNLLLGLLVPLLGLGGMRMVEKLNGVATSVGGQVLPPLKKAPPTAAAQVPAAEPPEPPKRRWIG